MLISEFELIQHFFNQEKTSRSDVIQGIGDDAAVLQPPIGQQLVVTTDTLVAGQHFPKNAAPADIGYKALAVNLSDLAAMGAEPAWILLALTLPTADEFWLKEFTQSFFSLLNRFQCQLVGGDITQGPLSITIQALGFVPSKKVLLRSGAQVGDRIYVTGTLGDAGLALAYLQKKTSHLFTQEQIKFFIARLNRPEPRIPVGLALRGIASSAIDISDGLAADVGHVLSASKVGAEIDLTKLPLSAPLKELAQDEAYQFALSAGDDYELCFTVSASHESELQSRMQAIDCPYTCIGIIKKEREVFFYCADGSPFRLKVPGFQHF